MKLKIENKKKNIVNFANIHSGDWFAYLVLNI